MRSLILFFALISAAIAQTVSNGVTVTATKDVDLAPDRAEFRVYIYGPSGSTLDQVLEAATASGVTAEHLLGMESFRDSSGTYMAFYFKMLVPFNQIRDTTSKLDQAQDALTAGRRFELDYSLYDVMPSDEAVEEAKNTILGDLFAEARRKATALARAAGVTLGSLRSIDDERSTSRTSRQIRYQVTVTYNLQ
jgi:hypothetical protein